MIKISLTEGSLIQVFSLYDLGNVIRAPEYIKGDVDLNYKIITDNGNYMLKYIVDPSHIPQFEIAGSLYEYLRSKGVVVPKIYKTKNDRYVENSFILYEFIEGAAKKDWTDKEMISLVNNFTKLLLALKEYGVPDLIKNKNDKYIKGGNIEYCHRIFKPEIFKLSAPEDIKQPIVETIDLLYSILSDFKKLPKHLIHGDLNEMNALFKDGENVGIIDFALSYDPVVYDLGEFSYWIAFPWWTKKFNNDRFKLIVDTFQKNISLSPVEIKLLPYMVLRRSMMDIMLTLQYYWSNQEKGIYHSQMNLLRIYPSKTALTPLNGANQRKIGIPEKRLKEQVERNNEIIKLINP